ncbi:MAG: MlaD family protein, partial [Fulvivirga sp.]|nr:MlaD family protein [Fulvivirga sp.]
MKKKLNRNITIGIFISVGILLFVGMVYYIGSRQAMFGDKIEVTANFKNVAGLQEGNNVRFSGIKIGTVDYISIASDSMATVHLLINESAASYIKTDSYVTIESVGLMGNKVVSISSGSVNAPPVKKGDHLPSRAPMSLDDVITSIKTTSDHARSLAANLNAISMQIKNAQGVLGMLVADSALAEDVRKTISSLEGTVNNAEQISAEMKQATTQLNEGEGLLTKALYEEEWSEDMNQTLDSLKSAGFRIKRASIEIKTFTEKLN